MLTSIVSAVHRISDWLDWLAKMICIPTALGFVIILLVQIFIRFVIHGSIAWSLEVIQVCFFWSVFMGISISWKDRSHIMFHFVIERLSPALQGFVLQFGYAAALVFFVYVVIYGFQDSIRLAPSYFEVLGVSENWSQIPVPFSGFIMAVHTIDRIFQQLLANDDIVGSVDGS